MQDMISAPESAAPFYRQEILRLLHDTDNATISFTATDAARIILGNTEADRAEPDTVVDFQETFG
jgi:hypothetical protein